MQPRDRHGAPYADRDTDEQRGYDDDRDVDAHDTPPFGVGGSAPPQTPPRSVADPAPAATATSGTARFEIRDRLIELDDLRQRGILSEEEFAAKKSELLNRI